MCVQGVDCWFPKAQDWTQLVRPSGGGASIVHCAHGGAEIQLRVVLNCPVFLCQEGEVCKTHVHALTWCEGLSKAPDGICSSES
jgi:hypothetical protein